MSNKRLFELGRLVATPGALAALKRAPTDTVELLTRHMLGDWGELEEEDVQANQQALKDGLRLLSIYRLRTGVKIWVITEADRSSTTLLLPEEY